MNNLIVICSSKSNIVEEKVQIQSLVNQNFDINNILVACATNKCIFNYDRSRLLLEIEKIDIALSTNFSLLRFIIPKYFPNTNLIICDSDIIFLQNPSILLDDVKKNQILMRKAYGISKWATSFMCLNLDKNQSTILFNYTKFLIENNLTKSDLLTFSIKLNDSIKFINIDKNWNSFDSVRPKTKLLHYTNLLTQPWIFPNHPHENLWFNIANDAISSGILKLEDINTQLKIDNKVFTNSKCLRSDFYYSLKNNKNCKSIKNMFNQFKKDLNFYGIKRYFFSKIL